jgi:predicted AlkP superfamily pyrophosphatase or phosphodiesterase
MKRKVCSIVLSFVFLFCFKALAHKPVKDLKPTVVLIALDGFRPDYLEKYQP